MGIVGKLFNVAMEWYNNEVSNIERKHEHHKRQAENMSTEDLVKGYKKLDNDKDFLKKHAYAETLKTHFEEK